MLNLTNVSSLLLKLFPSLCHPGEGIQIDKSKIEAMKSWSILTTIMEVCSFYGQTSFYRRFIKDFSSILGPLTERMNKNSFE